MDRKAINFKTDQRGLNMDPTNGAIIKGNQGYTPLTFENQIDDTFILSPYGTVSYASAGQDNKLVIPGMSVTEIPANKTKSFNYSNSNNMNPMQYAQAGGGADQQQQQMMQYISVYCQVVKGGEECAQEIIQHLQSKQVSDSEKNKLLTQIQNTVQKALQQQQQQEQQQQQAEMGQQDEEDQIDEEQQMQSQGMMEEGGQPCFDCFDHYNPSPQAQNLNWFYKEQGGQAYNEAFPQAQTYLPYMRKGETRPNFMFEEGGDTDDQWGGQYNLDQIYNAMKKGGLAMDPKKKKGSAFDPNSFQDYIKKGGGDKKKKVEQPQTPQPPRELILNQDPYYFHPNMGTTQTDFFNHQTFQGIPWYGLYGQGKAEGGWGLGMGDYAARERRYENNMSKDAYNAYLLQQYGTNNENEVDAILKARMLEGMVSPSEEDGDKPRKRKKYDDLEFTNVPEASEEDATENQDTRFTNAYTIEDDGSDIKDKKKRKKDLQFTTVTPDTTPIPAPSTTTPGTAKTLQEQFNELQKQAKGGSLKGFRIGGFDELDRDAMDAAGFDWKRYNNPNRAQRHFDRRENYQADPSDPMHQFDSYRGKGWRPQERQMREKYEQLMNQDDRFDASRYFNKNNAFRDWMGGMSSTNPNYDTRGWVKPPTNTNQPAAANSKTTTGTNSGTSSTPGAPAGPSTTPGNNTSATNPGTNNQGTSGSNFQHPANNTGYNPSGGYNVNGGYNPYASNALGQQLGNIFGGNPFLTGMTALGASMFPGAMGGAGMIPGMMPGMFGRSKFKMNLGVPGGGRWDLKGKNMAANILAMGALGSGYNTGAGLEGQGAQGNQGTQESNVYPQTGPNPNYIPYRMDAEDDPNKWGRIPSSTTNTYPQTGPNPNQLPYRMDQEDDPNKFGTYSTESPTAGFMPPLTGKKEGGDLSTYRFGSDAGDFKYVYRPGFNQQDFGNVVNSQAMVSGMLDAMDKKKQEKEQDERLSSMDTVSLTPFSQSASKNKNAAIGSTNAMGFNDYNPGSQNFGYDNFQPEYLGYSKMGGSILDYYEDGSEVDLAGLSPEEQQAFIDQIISAGGNVEFI